MGSVAQPTAPISTKFGRILEYPLLAASAEFSWMDFSNGIIEPKIIIKSCVVIIILENF